jgi:hypothetical protein
MTANQLRIRKIVHILIRLVIQQRHGLIIRQRMYLVQLYPQSMLRKKLYVRRLQSPGALCVTSVTKEG